MRIRLFGAALAAGLVVSFAPAARADIIQLRDGKCLPAGTNVKLGDAPTDEQMDELASEMVRRARFSQRIRVRNRIALRRAA